MTAKTKVIGAKAQRDERYELPKMENTFDYDTEGVRDDMRMRETRNHYTRDTVETLEHIAP